MLSYTELNKGVIFIYQDAPYEVLESYFSRMQQRKAVVQAKIKNLVTGKVIDLGLQASDQFEEAEVSKRPLVFLYSHRGEYIFNDPTDKKNRFSLKEERIAELKRWLKPNTEVTALFFLEKGVEKIINLSLPVKMDFKVTEAPPGIQGDRSKTGTKSATLETGAIIQVPLFINSGDIIRVNTESGNYTERIEKAS